MAKLNLLLLSYNNYFNRIIKRHETIQEYQEYDSQVFTGIAFNPNDGVSTTQFINWSEDWTPDYLVAFNDDGSIDSRWFVMEFARTRAGQYKLTLRRDVVTDHYSEVIEAPTFIQKATIPSDNPLIFNSEGMTFNEIKTEETPLKDETKCGWIVGFLDNNVALEEDAPITSKFAKDTDFVVDSLTDMPIYYLNGKRAYTRAQGDYKSGAKFKMTYKHPNLPNNTELTFRNDLILEYMKDNPFSPVETGFSANSNDYEQVADSIVESFNDKITESSLISAFRSRINKSLTGLYEGSRTLASYHGRIVYCTSDNKYYQISVTETPIDQFSIAIDSQDGALYTEARAAVQSTGYFNMSQPWYGEAIKVSVPFLTYNVRFSETVNPTNELYFKFPKEYRHLSDAPYSMFCIPYVKEGYAFAGQYPMNSSISLGIANALANFLQPASGGGHLIDLQLLPYCPLQNYSNPSDPYPGISIVGMSSDDIVEVRRENEAGSIIGYFFWCNVSSFNITINYDITIEDPKISKECDKYRLVSPNHASISEFSPAMNGGVNFFHVNCTYKPFTPFINVHPNYGGLYGLDFDDSRGLICGGDYSLPVMSDAWQSYQIQNKNYAAIFDREIENMEVNNKLQMVNQVGSAIAGTAQGALTGAMAGGVAGAIVGGVASAAGGIADTAMLGIQQAEAKNFKTDMYNYNLGNIQAKPQGLAKSSGFDINNKIWPYLEYYTCTETEKQAFINKIRFDGMTVGVIGTIKDYLWPTPTFIKGQIIRIQIKEDSHLTNEIYAEIAKGVYI